MKYLHEHIIITSLQNKTTPSNAEANRETLLAG
jgi:hypothetical protein